MATDLRQLILDEGLHQPPAVELKESENEASKKRVELFNRYANRMAILPALNRSLVSFQANKATPFYRWLKYREGFSHELVRYLLHRYKPEAAATILDPFAGAGTTLTTATKEGWCATGIELLPVGVAAIRARLVADKVDTETFEETIQRFESFPLDGSITNGFRFQHLRITEKAFPEETEQAMSSYLAFVDSISDPDVRYLAWFACFAILEDVSYTRKDGQYLRWDNRSGRDLKAKFDKGVIHDFKPAVSNKLRQMLEDLKGRDDAIFSETVRLIEGSSLSELPTLSDDYFALILTSPPYCNRYDYTRTYALELAFLGHDETDVKNLRQTLLSATVENKTKRNWLREQYRARNQEERFERIDSVFTNQEALHEILELLYAARDRQELNNNNIPNLVENYFYEMCFIVHELARVLASKGHVIMVNDNVRYIGEEIPVDLILSDFASSAGLSVDNIWVLPRGKGNSSQQMGIHGRAELRKCVYVWSKPS